MEKLCNARGRPRLTITGVQDYSTASRKEEGCFRLPGAEERKSPQKEWCVGLGIRAISRSYFPPLLLLAMELLPSPIFTCTQHFAVVHCWPRDPRSAAAFSATMPPSFLGSYFFVSSSLRPAAAWPSEESDRCFLPPRAPSALVPSPRCSAPPPDTGRTRRRRG